MSTVLLPTRYKQVEYIESHGSEYINTGYKPNYNTKILTKISHNETAIDTPIFGSRGTNQGYWGLWSHPIGYSDSDRWSSYF